MTIPDKEAAVQFIMDSFPDIETHRDYGLDLLKSYVVDMAMPYLQVAVDIGDPIDHEDGGKYDFAIRNGWAVYRCDIDTALSGRALDTIGSLVMLRGG